MAILLTKGQSGPEGLVADRLTDDLGTVRQGTERSVSFRVTNRFRRTMTIREIQTGCSCMSSSTDERVIPSGATTEIRIRWSAGVRSGPHDDAITILGSSHFVVAQNHSFGSLWVKILSRKYSSSR
jgi:hypothetical protein